MADACRKTIKVLVKNSVEDVENQIICVMRDLCLNLKPKIDELLEETTESCSTGALPHSLIQFLDTNLIFLKDNLNEPNFDRILSILWRIVSDSIYKLVNEAVTLKKPKLVFTILHNSFKVLINFFHGDGIPTDDPNLLVTNRLLKLYCCNGEDLLLAYYDQRYIDQRVLSAGSTYPIGSVTIRAVVDSGHLRIEILNARHLKPLIVQRQQESRNEDTLKQDFRDKLDDMRMHIIHEAMVAQRTHERNGIHTCNPYISVRLVPDVQGTKYQRNKIVKVKTKTSDRTLFPL